MAGSHAVEVVDRPGAGAVQRLVAGDVEVGADLVGQVADQVAVPVEDGDGVPGVLFVFLVGVEDH